MPHNLYVVGIIPTRIGSSRFPGRPLWKIAESGEMNRVFEHECDARMVYTQYDVYSVMTEDDRAKETALMATDPLTDSYRSRA